VRSVRSVDAAAVVEVRRGPARFDRDGPGSEPGFLVHFHGLVHCLIHCKATLEQIG
jgi:hypothetical protein